MAFTPANVIAEVRPIINDAAGTRWPDAELLRLCFSAYMEIFMAQPEAWATTWPFRCIVGSRQSLLDDFAGPQGVVLLDVVGNCDANRNLTAGNIERTTRSEIDRQIPGWQAATPSDVTRYWMHDERDVSTFYVYPPRATTDSSKRLLLRCSIPPAVPATVNVACALPDSWQPAIRDYLCGMAMLKDDTFAASPLSSGYLARFDRALGLADGATEATARRRDRAEG